MEPTEEQQSVIDAYREGETLVVEAGAGCGKTWTLAECARAVQGRKTAYMAYSKPLQRDAATKFPPHVTCKTAHSWAHAARARPFLRRLDEKRRIPAREGARLLGVHQPLAIASRGEIVATLAPASIYRFAMAAVTSFCQSADADLSARHVQIPLGVDSHEKSAAFAEAILPLARQAWSDLVDPEGVLSFFHDVYLKLWQLSEPRLPVDVVLFDEAQDANPAIADVVDRQRDHAQVVLVGDSNQQLFGWRGAIDAMVGFDGRRLMLSQSFRFGQAIADEANKWLSHLDTELRLRGNPEIASTIGTLAQADAILCRTNAGVIAECMHAIQERRRVALVGSDEQIRKLAEAAVTLKAGQGTDHPELCLFKTWGELQEYVQQDQAGSDLKTFVQIIDTHGPDAVIATMACLVDEHSAETVVSTAHKSKGREWASVRASSDFRVLGTGEIDRTKAMLAYVTCTRARMMLDRGGLDWG